MTPIALVLAGCCVAFVFGEIGLRVFGVSYPYFYIPDHLTGYTLKPGAEGLWNKEGEVYITINQAGLRDRDHSPEKPFGTFRIAVLGDSYTEAMQVGIEDTFWKQIENELSGCPSLAGRNVEALNFGVSGYSTAQELLVLRHKIPLYDPDLVLTAFFTENDVRGNSRKLDVNNVRPYFIMNDRRLVLDDSFRRSMEFWLQQLPFSSEAFEISRVLQVAREAKYKLKAYWQEFALQQGLKKRENRDIDINFLVYLEPVDPDWEKAWKITEDLVVLMKQEAEERGIRFLLVSLSNSDQAHPDVQHRQMVARQVGMPDLYYPDRRIQDLASRKSIELLSLAEPFAAYAQQHGVFLHGFQNTHMGKGHWNAAGHRLAGHLMAEKICAMLVAPKTNPQQSSEVFLFASSGAS